MESGAAAVENNLVLSQKVNIELPHDPAVPLLGIYIEGLKAGSERDICTLHSMQYYSQQTTGGSNPGGHQKKNG